MLFNDDSDAPRIRMNGRQKLFIIAVDLGIVIELCVAMACATSVPPEAFTPTFMKTFFAMFLPTLLLGFGGFRRLRDRAENA
jgi:hypothetical protein